MNSAHNEHTINQLAAHLFRENSGKMIAVLSHKFGINQIDAILDVVQDTFETALTQWRFSSIPDNPSAWLMAVAKNKAINTFTRNNKTQEFSPSLHKLTTDYTALNQQPEVLLSDQEVQDSQLRLLFTCCQPDFSTKNQVILTLHILCGFGIPEIANALFMQKESVKKALTRSKAILRNLAPFFQSQQSDKSIELTNTILYLMFNEGYKTTRNKEGINNDLCYESIRLAKLLVRINESAIYETKALLALQFFNLSRFPARITEHGEWLTLEEQDRTLWNKSYIEEGFYYLTLATQSNVLSRYHLEAIISSLHCIALNFADTNWTKIIYLYQQLEILEPDSPFIILNRIIAESYIRNPLESIAKINLLEAEYKLQENFLIVVTKASLYQKIGEIDHAKETYMLAWNLTNSPIDKKFIDRKILECQH
ncbi:RNA polymerase sigma factor [Flavobacterium sp. '19STA2R22 D10 B1']|uniref:RNA polymerase sigma factor n=1 Tax=Flavobacterium aerium TaxID=3037261 RepID=UPI00278C51EE|nr:sigma-70 family RNA polymerase sigma factor [Flavobacterium sp. '19STA2R22 D10 B1']